MGLKDMKLEGVDGVHLNEERDQWKASVNTVITLLVS
jgi:hypothetical protein